MNLQDKRLMKRGQLLSQPFFYIFAMVVIGLTIFFGYYIINRLQGTACQVENQQFLADLEKNINRIYSIGYAGSSQECAIVSRYGQSELKCELLKPSGIKGMCFVEATQSLDYRDVNIKQIREELEALAGEKDRNLFFLAQGDCELNSVKLKEVSIPEPICISNEVQPVKIILENTGTGVKLSRSR